MTSALAKQIERRMTAFDLNPKSLSKKAGLNDTAVRDILEGRSKNPRSDTLQKIAKTLGCTVGDLTGETPPQRMLKIHSDTVAINELDVHPQAGLGEDEQGTIMEAHEAAAIVGVHTFPAASFREAYGVDASRIKIVAVRGDSMEPKLWAGQRVMVDTGDKIPSPPGIFIVWDGLGIVLKRVSVVAGSNPLKGLISSDNSAYPAYERLYSEAYINGRVIGIWART